MTALSSKRIAVYARFSSDRQSESSIADQVERCRGFVEHAGGALDPELVFTDYAISGASLVRPGFEALMRAVDSKKVDVIVTEDLSRISRDMADSALIFKKLQFASVPLMGVADGIDTTRKDAKLAFALKSLIADVYLDDLRDKTLRGMQGRARAGRSTGGLPYGYRSRARDDRSFDIEVDAERAKIVRRIFTLYAERRSYADIAEMLNKECAPTPRASPRRRLAGWCPTAIREILKNEKYVGVWRFGQRKWVKVPGTNTRRPQRRDAHEVVEVERPELRIVDELAWAAVQSRFEKEPNRTIRVPRKRRLYLLSGLLRCGACRGCVFRHDLGARSGVTWARVPIAPGH